MGALIDLSSLGALLALMLLGYFVGGSRERKHLASIRGREEGLIEQPVTSARPTTEQLERVEAQLFTGSVVISIDYFKQFASNLRNLLGGRVESVISLTDRGRREAILRVREQAQQWGASEIVNLRLSTSTIARGRNGNTVSAISVLAYGTALRVRKSD